MDNALEPTLVVRPTLETEIVHVSAGTSLWIVVVSILSAVVVSSISSPSPKLNRIVSCG